MTTTSDLLGHLQVALAERYRLEREIGRGGMATVYLAEDLKHRRPVALKVLSPDLAASLGTDRFLREIEIAARLTHPHILSLHDSGEADGLLYYVMPYVEGESLRGRLSRNRQLPLDDAVRISREVADALDYAHGRDVVHRDIKPENILFQAGHAVVSDFGIARAIRVAGVKRFTGSGIAVGTPGYMSPEQASGIEQLDGRSDLYSLACVLYEMLAGDPPFTGWSAQAILARQAIEPVPPLRAVRDTVPDWLEQVVVRALAKSPADRFATAADFIAALAKHGPLAFTSPALPLVQPPPAANSIAVLPFLNMSAEPENEYFSDGITEEIINALSAVGSLRVASRTSSFAFKGATQDIRTIAEKLQVSAVLEGSVRRADTKLRVTAQLISAADGFHLWSATYEREMKDVFAIQDEIARAIVNALKVKLTSEPRLALVEPRTDNVEAYALYLKARYFWRRKSANGLKKGIEYFEQAIALDPRYSLAYAGLADSYTALGYYNYLPPKQVFPRAREAADRALAIDDGRAEAHTARACVSLLYDWDWTGAEQGFQRAIQLKELYPTAHFWYACCLWAMGRTADSVEQASRAQALAPLSLVANANLGWAFYFARRYDEAIAQCRKVLDLDTHYLLTYVVLGQVHLAACRYDEAIRALQSAVSVSEGLAFTSAVLGHVYGRAGRRREAKKVLENLEQRARAGYVSPFCGALVHAGLGDRDQAFASLEQAYEERSNWLAYLKTWPLMDDLRGDARFTALLGRVGLG
ncbi:MAG TPA: protein kinase [Gemmatimonadales bacterium]|nr:protein kinase [Gemmatimonadales bacterium]